MPTDRAFLKTMAASLRAGSVPALPNAMASSGATGKRNMLGLPSVAAGSSLLFLKFSLFTIPVNIGLFWLGLDSYFAPGQQVTALLLLSLATAIATAVSAFGVHFIFVEPLNRLTALINAAEPAEMLIPAQDDALGEFSALARSFNMIQARQHQSARRLRRAHDALSQIYSATPTLIMTLNVNGQITHASSFWQESTGYGMAELTGLPLMQFLDEESRDTFTSQTLPILLTTGHVRDIPLRIRCKNGIEIDVLMSAVARTKEADSGRPGSKWLFCAMSDVTLMKKAEQQLRKVSLTDPLTGLANRGDLSRYLNDLFANGTLEQERAAVLFIDLDNFKPINDTYGHRVGDRVLAEVAKRLQDNVRTIDYVSRIGGDEFAVVCRNVKTETGAILAAKRLLTCLKSPIDLGLGGPKGKISASIGVAMLSQGTLSPGQALEMADIAMYQAKSTGRNTYALWTHKMLTRPTPSPRALALREL